MSEDERSPLQQLGQFVLALALLPGFLGLATEYWLSDDITSRHVGLWKSCGDASCESLSLDDIPEWYSAVRGLCVMALCLHVISAVTGCCCTCIGIHDVDTFSFLTRLEEAAAVVAGILMGGGLGVFARSTQAHLVFRNFHFDWSFWLCLVHVCLLLLCGGIIGLAKGDCACRKCCSRGHMHQRLPKRKLTLVPVDSAHPPRTLEYKLCYSSEKVKPLVFSELPLKNSALQNSLLDRLEHSGSPRFFSSLEGMSRIFQNPLKQKKETDVV